MQTVADAKLVAAASYRLQQMERREVFDVFRPGSRPTEFQQRILDDFCKVQFQYVVAGNRSGKTQLGARIMAWMLAEDKPGWVRPERWGKAPLLMLVIGRISKQVEEAIYRKIRSFFDDDELHEMRVGNALQKVTHKRTGNSIIFASHHNANEAREKVQAYELVGVMLDEMPSSVLLFEELQRRVQDKKGFFFSSFTPKTRNTEIKRLVEAASLPEGKRYKLRMFDNPIYTDEDKASLLKSLDSMPESYRQCVLEGDWMDDDTAVYHVPDGLIRTPPNYSSGWRHVEAADPALQSKHGQVVFAEDPVSNAWYVVRADYIQGIAVPAELVKAATDRLKGMNIVRRVCDSASTWYIGTASSMGFTYITPWDKNNRRAEFMKNLQSALGTRLFVAPWCDELVNELGSMQWSETSADRVVNSHSYHLHDACIYGWDCLPKPDGGVAPIPELHVRLRIKQEQDAARATRPKKQGNIRIGRRSHAWR
jgi:hypothetical protein